MIKVDIREREVAKYLEERGIEFESLPLLVGDFEIGDYIIERKSVQDLAASIKDGRYAEQKQRLAALPPEKSVIFVIEGSHSFDESKKKFGLPNGTIVSAVMMTSLRDSHFLFQTSNAQETSYFLTALAGRLEKVKEKKIEKEYEPNVVKLCRRENVTLESCFRSQLCTIPLVSLKTADAIREHLGVDSMSTLVKKLEADEKMLLLKVPGVGPGVAKSILQHLGIGIVKKSVEIEEEFIPTGSMGFSRIDMAALLDATKAVKLKPNSTITNSEAS
jgi:ERCC4-type nuclease